MILVNLAIYEHVIVSSPTFGVSWSLLSIVSLNADNSNVIAATNVVPIPSKIQYA